MSEKHYLLSLAGPTFLVFMWPTLRERRSSRFHHFLAQWVLFHAVWIIDALFDAHVDSPSTVLGVFQVLSRWLIVLFPAIKGDLTVKTHHVIGVGYSWFVVKAGFGKLVLLVSNACINCNESEELTCVGEGDLCGHFKALDVFVFEALLLG